MINIYQKPTETSFTIGLSYEHFATETIGNEHHVFKSELEVNNFLIKFKRDILADNLETFWLYCDKVIEQKSINAIEAIKQLQEIVSSNINVEKGFDNMKKSILDKRFNAFRILVKSLPKEKRVAGIYMAATMVVFLKQD